ncbi:MAG: hypothetical protein AB2693_03125, partial [Candidatus Thiodiazotropha sp.]
MRREKVEEIMSSRNDSRMFYKLISAQRKGKNTQLQTLVVNGVERRAPDESREGWAEHFQKLAMPQDNPSLDQRHKQIVDLDIESISLLCREENCPIENVTEDEVTQALRRLNNNKAVDIMGLTAEHFKLAGYELSEFLTYFLNYLLESKTISAVLKEGILTPIFKKGDPSDPGNYRGITVTPVLLKVLEHILNNRHGQ